MCLKKKKSLLHLMFELFYFYFLFRCKLQNNFRSDAIEFNGKEISEIKFSGVGIFPGDTYVTF